MRMSAERVAENIAEVANDMVLMMARDIISSLSQAIAILNHPAVRAALTARTMWDAVAAIDRRLRRPARPTLSHLRRGRAGMVVLAWLADFVERADRAGGTRIDSDNPVLGAALDWVDETIALIRSEEEAAASHQPGGSPSSGSWHDLGR
jgi:phage gpG-like protein